MLHSGVTEQKGRSTSRAVDTETIQENHPHAIVSAVDSIIIEKVFRCFNENVETGVSVRPEIRALLVVLWVLTETEGREDASSKGFESPCEGEGHKSCHSSTVIGYREINSKCVF